MPMRLSITIDSETVDSIDRFAKEKGMERNRAIIECIQAGLQKLSAGEPVSIPRANPIEDYKEIKAALGDVKAALANLSEEIRLMHHTIEAEWLKENRAVPYQSRKWYEFWKT
ncbi:MAG: type II secretion system protein E [Methanolinea sp.]